METVWFMIVAVMVAAYVVLDGFDLGAGVIYLAATKTADERRRIMRAIGPVWDGNEVWLLAGVIALVTLTTHGSLYVAVKTEDELNGRARRVAQWLWPVQLLLTVAGLIATVAIRPGVLDNYKHHAVGFAIPVLVFGALAVMMHGLIKRPD